MELTVENTRYGGCVDSITKKLVATFNTENIEINTEQGTIGIDIDETKRYETVKVLLNLGYPKIDSVRGFTSTKAKAKSFSACAVGKMGQ